MDKPNSQGLQAKKTLPGAELHKEIAERKLAEEALKESQRFLETIIETAPT